jgi:hypothetical protein
MSTHARKQDLSENSNCLVVFTVKTLRLFSAQVERLLGEKWANNGRVAREEQEESPVVRIRDILP